MIAGASLLVASVAGGYYGAELRVARHEEQREQGRRQQLEDILACSYKVDVTSTYKYKYVNPLTGNNVEELHDEESFGTATAIASDAQGTYLLTSHHVVADAAEKDEAVLVAPFLFARAKAYLKKTTIRVTGDDANQEPATVVTISEKNLPDTFDAFIEYPDLALIRTAHHHPSWGGRFAQDVHPGDQLYSVGIAGGDWYKHLITGIVRSTTDTTHPNTITPTTLPLMGGNSGGGVWKVYNGPEGPELAFVGVNRATFKGPELSAISSLDAVKTFLEHTDLKERYKR